MTTTTKKTKIQGNRVASFRTTEKVFINNAQLAACLKQAQVEEMHIKRAKEEQKKKYEMDKLYFKATIEAESKNYFSNHPYEVVRACKNIINRGYKIYIVNNDNKISDMGGKLTFPVRYKAIGSYEKAFIAKIGVDNSIMKLVMKDLAEYVEKGILVMKNKRNRG